MRKKQCVLLLLPLLLSSCHSESPSSTEPTVLPASSTLEEGEGYGFDAVDFPLEYNDYSVFQFHPIDESTCSIELVHTPLRRSLIVPSFSPEGRTVVEMADCETHSHPTRCAQLTEIQLPSSLKKIDSAALNFGIALQFLRVPDGVTEIQPRAFSGLDSLEELTLPANLDQVPELGIDLLKNLKSVYLPFHATGIQEGALRDCVSLEEAPLPYGLKTVGASAFEGCVSLREVRVPKSVDLVGDSAYRGCSSLSGLTLEDGVAALGAGAFKETALRKVFLPKSLASVGAGCFEGCPEDLVIYCEVETRPEGWDAHFDDPRDSHKVVWGAKREDAK